MPHGHHGSRLQGGLHELRRGNLGADREKGARRKTGDRRRRGATLRAPIICGSAERCDVEHVHLAAAAPRLVLLRVLRGRASGSRGVRDCVRASRVAVECAHGGSSSRQAPDVAVACHPERAVDSQLTVVHADERLRTVRARVVRRLQPAAALIGVGLRGSYRVARARRRWRRPCRARRPRWVRRPRWMRRSRVRPRPRGADRRGVLPSPRSSTRRRCRR